MVPHGSNAPRGITDPYRYVLHTAPLLPWVHYRTPYTRHPAATAVYSVYGVREQCPGLNGPVSLRAKGTRRPVTGLQFLYLRQSEPGSQSQSQAIQGKCWIDPGSPGPRLPGLLGPEMDCIWLLLALFYPVLDPFDPCWMALDDPGCPDPDISVKRVDF